MSCYSAVADSVGACNLELGACEDISLQWINLQ